MNPDNTDFAAPQKAATALGRYGRAEEVAAAIAFLASPGSVVHHRHNAGCRWRFQRLIVGIRMPKATNPVGEIQRGVCLRNSRFPLQKRFELSVSTPFAGWRF